MTSAAKVAWPPGPAEPASEQVRRWIEGPVDFWEACERAYGPVVRLELGSLGTVVLLSDPAHARQLFQLPADAFECAPYNQHYRLFMGDHGVLLQDGEEHLRQRRLLAPSFRHDQLLPSARVVRDAVRRIAAAWPAGDAFNPRPDLHEMTFQVVLHLVFGDVDSPTSQALLGLYRGAVVNQVGSWGPWRNFSRLKPRIRELLAREIVARRADGAIPGLLTRVAQARLPSGEPVTDAECEDHVFSMMIAGVDTAAVLLAWALHWLGQEPVVQDRLVAELEAASAARAAGAGDATDRGEPRALPYLDAVYRETLRMYPVVPTPSGRRLTRDAEIGDWLFPAGTTLLACSYLAHRRPAHFPAGDQFRPERFVGRRFEPHVYFPFGGGVRRCAGEALAELEFKVALATILEHWRVQPAEEAPLRPVRHGTLLAPPESFRVRLRPVADRREVGGA